MKKFLLLFLLLGQLFAIDATKNTIINLEKQNIPIVDIRTPREWQETGTIPNTLKITFFTENGINRNFLYELKQNHISKSSKFAIICRTGHRSKIATQILIKNGYKNVIDLQGGMFRLFKSLLKGLNNGK